MDIAAAQHEIDAMLKALKEAKEYSGLGADDPSVIALEQIMLAKVGALEATKAEAARAGEATLADPAAQPLPSSILLAATHEETTPAPAQPAQEPK